MQNEVPVPRLLRASTAVTVGTGPIIIPGQSFLASYTPEGALPPIRTTTDPGAVHELTFSVPPMSAHHPARGAAQQELRGQWRRESAV